LSKSGNTAEHWDHVAREWVQKGYSNELLAEHKRKTYLSLIARWADVASAQSILKTDLFQEASGPDQFLFDLGQVNSNVIGIDVSNEIVGRAKSRARHYGVDAGKYLCCDVRHLPFRDSSISLIISDSTLDHFPGEADIVTALKELGRALRTGGVLILTMDNKSNPTYPPYIVFRIWMGWGFPHILSAKRFP
jgi:ubiquinone/menaquinone biosynthesis C-methylase UbiE